VNSFCHSREESIGFIVNSFCHSREGGNPGLEEKDKFKD